MIGHNSSHKQTVYRSNPETGYTIISNLLLQDKNLSYEALGLLCNILSRPTDWEINVANIAQSGPAGRDKVYRILRELEDAKYAKRDIDRRSNGSYLKHRFLVSDDPEFLIKQTARELVAMMPLPENPEVDRSTVVPFPEKPEVARRARMAENKPSNPLPENPEVVNEPLPENPLTAFQEVDKIKSREKGKKERDSSSCRKTAPFAAASAVVLALEITGAAAGVHQQELPIEPPPAQTEMLSVEEVEAAVVGGYNRDFECFWELYPRKIGKGAAFKSWQKLKLPQKRKAYVALKQQFSILSAKANDSRGNFCPYPATWINQGRFDDDPDGITEGQRKQPPQSNYGPSGHTGQKEWIYQEASKHSGRKIEPRDE